MEDGRRVDEDVDLLARGAEAPAVRVPERRVAAAERAREAVERRRAPRVRVRGGVAGERAVGEEPRELGADAEGRVHGRRGHVAPAAPGAPVRRRRLPRARVVGVPRREEVARDVLEGVARADGVVGLLGPGRRREDAVVRRRDDRDDRQYGLGARRVAVVVRGAVERLGEDGRERQFREARAAGRQRAGVVEGADGVERLERAEQRGPGRFRHVVEGLRPVDAEGLELEDDGREVAAQDLRRHVVGERRPGRLRVEAVAAAGRLAARAARALPRLGLGRRRQLEGLEARGRRRAGLDEARVDDVAHAADGHGRLRDCGRDDELPPARRGREGAELVLAGQRAVERDDEGRRRPAERVV